MIYKRGKDGKLNHISAGGVVYKIHNNKPKILVMYRGDFDSWHLSKGTPKTSEDKRKAAEREIEEETGLNVKLGKYLGKLNSQWFDQWEGKKELINKTTYYWLAEVIGGKIKLDIEHQGFRWVAPNKAIELLKKYRPYQILDSKKILWEDEAEIVKKAIKLLK